jgi:hypothetical protein
MGLDAFVRCRCWEDGGYQPPPIPVSVDEDGILSATEPCGDEEWRAVDAWKATACPHEDMEAASEHISNWGGYRAFQSALETAGWQHFPTLKAELPNANGGQMPAEASTRAFAELIYFTEHADVGTETVLLDEDTGTEVTAYIAAYHGETYFYLDWRAGVSPDGFVVRKDGQPVFQSMRFEQIGDDLVDGDQRVKWFMKEPLGEGAKRFHVVTRPITTDHFGYVVEPLKILCRASIETGNPVVWC